MWGAAALCGFILFWWSYSSDPWGQIYLGVFTNDKGHLCAIYVLWGVALGGLQFWRESRGDRRAFLFHRPISPARIFLAKVLAGGILFFGAAVPPFLFAVLSSVYQPHPMKPFDWRMSLPHAIDICCGTIAYLAAALCVSRPARWYLSRGVPLMFALTAIVLAVRVTEFWQALLIILFFDAVLALAAFGSFLTAGTYAPQPRIARVALIFVLLIGLLSLVTVLSLSLNAEYGFRESLGACREYHEYFVQRNGSVLLGKVKANWYPYYRDSYENIEEVADLNGHAVPVNSLRSVSGVLLGRARPDRELRYAYRDEMRYYEFVASDDVAPKFYRNLWYYVRSARRFVAFGEGGRIGSLGPDGFAPTNEAGAGFEGELKDSGWYQRGGHKLVWAFGDNIYTIDFEKRSVTRVRDLPEGEHIECFSFTNLYLETTYLLTNTSIHVLDANFKDLLGIARQFDARAYPSVIVYKTTAGYCVWYSANDASYSPTPPGAPPEQISLLDETGTVLKTTPLPIRGLIIGAANAPMTLDPPQLPESVSWRNLISAELLPPAGILATKYFDDEESAQLSLSFGIWSPLALGANALAMICCILVVLWACRRYALSRGLFFAWTALALLTGLAGLLVFLSVYDWPARENCASCKRKRVVTRDACEHCGAAFPSPPRDGTEIFEAVAERASIP